MPIHHSSAGHELRVTRRCLIEDLGFRPEAVNVPLAELAQGRTEGARLLRSFLDQRDHAPEPDDENELEGLAPDTPRLYPFRRGERQRGVTWYQRKDQIVWFVAAHHAHVSGAVTDSYVYFRSLRREELLPESEDVVRWVDERSDAEADAIYDEVPELMRQAAATPDVEIRGHVGRVPIGILMTADVPPHLYLSVSRLWERVGVTPPEKWVFALLTKVYGHQYEDGDYLPFESAMPGRARTADEDIYADFVSDWPREP